MPRNSPQRSTPRLARRRFLALGAAALSAAAALAACGDEPEHGKFHLRSGRSWGS